MTQGPGSPNQWLILTLEGCEYALPVQNVVEVLRMVAVRPLPEAPAWVAGMLNLRGQGILVMDLRTRLGLSLKAPDLGSQIVVVASAGELLGLIADDVVEIITLPPNALKPANSSRMLSGVAHAGDRLLLVLDVERLADEGGVHAGT